MQNYLEFLSCPKLMNAILMRNSNEIVLVRKMKLPSLKCLKYAACTQSSNLFQGVELFNLISFILIVLGFSVLTVYNDHDKVFTVFVYF